jgi:hypothetical protein
MTDEELTALDLAVARAMGIDVATRDGRVWSLKRGYAAGSMVLNTTFSPTRSWSDAGPLVERYDITLGRLGEQGWTAFCSHRPNAAGSTPLIAICRAVIAAEEATDD